MFNDQHVRTDAASSLSGRLFSLECKLDQVVVLLSDSWATSVSAETGVGMASSPDQDQAAAVLKYLNAAAPEFVPVAQGGQGKSKINTHFST